MELPLATEPPVERADAERNRRRILEAAARLYAERPDGLISMDAVARAAGVGKGTVFRRFGDREGLLVALLGEDERALQDAILRGPPPLGPGAQPAERLRAFAAALLDLIERRGALLRAAETATPGARLRGGAYGAWHQHVAFLLEELGAHDPPMRAHALLAPLAAETAWTLLHDQDVPRVRLEAAIDALWSAAG
jgi:AcrR family transcriptional regulator